ncbi:MAG: 30S ribosomal protein S27ae [Candidatus Diapherotrites archaeon CG08_land_8_20_14_0_20_30_16]|nr:MAG: 30S ribosomal protein S27ae [Candidatus Diapherotrites archaeon CG08_land_8_20_14_0_20_30_16]
MVEKKEKTGKRQHKKTKRIKKSSFYKVEGNNVIRTRKTCLKCGAGVFMAEHKNRYSCGKCGYTEMKK